MHVVPEVGSTDEAPAVAPPDWPEPGTPLPAEEATVELPVVTPVARAADAPAAAPVAPDAPSLATAQPAQPRVRRVPALERRGPRPVGSARSARAAARAAATVGLDDLLTGWTVTEHPWPDPAEHPAEANGWTVTEHPWPDNDPAEADGWTVTADPGPGEDPAEATDWTENDQLGPDGTDADLSGSDDPDEEPANDGPPPPDRRWLIGAGIAAVALLLIGTTVVLLNRGGDPGGATPAGWNAPAAAAPAPAAPAPAAHTITAALAGRTSAGFELVDNAKRVTLRAADLGDDLYRITTPDGDAALPRAEEQDGRVRLRLGGGAQAVDITLNAAVLWDLRVAGGSEQSTIDLSAGRVGGVDLTGGATRIALTLPRPDGTLSVRMSGGVNNFDVRAAEQTPVRVRVGSGAGQVTLNGQNHGGVSAGRTFTPASWGDTVDRIDVDAAAGMAAMTVAPY